MDYVMGEWDKLSLKLEDKLCFLFLDYDGTLVPIAKTPQEATLPRETKKLLDGLARNKRIKIAIISGRSLEDLKAKINLENLIYVGNHGFEIGGPKLKFVNSIPYRYRTILDRIKGELVQKLAAVEGVILEDKGFSLSLHYRLVENESIPHVKSIFQEATIIHVVKEEVKIKKGKMVMEITPPFEWDKGKVTLWLLARQNFAADGKKVFPIYLGDDLTDEDAFKALNKRGMTIFVGQPRRSYAHYYLKDPNEVVDFLKRLSAILSS